jgi:adenine deaminase
MQTEIITKKDESELLTKDGNVLASKDKDIWKVAAFDRTFGSKNHAIGFLKNFGAQVGAFASTWSFHENDMIVIGSNDKDMAIAANNLIKTQGGMIVVSDGKILASLPLQMAGIISTDSFEKVSQNFADLNSTLVESGCKFKKPHLIPLFLPFLALPSIRILFSGMVDVENRCFIPSFN